MTSPSIITYHASLSNARDLWVEGDRIHVEDRPPEQGGKPITEAELALVERVRREKGWTVFGISQSRGFAWRKSKSGDWPCDRFMWLEGKNDEMTKRIGGRL